MIMVSKYSRGRLSYVSNRGLFRGFWSMAGCCFLLFLRVPFLSFRGLFTFFLGVGDDLPQHWET
jgi:hypothetical protein